MQLMQIVGERNVRIVPDVAVSGANANPGMVDGLLGLMLRNQTNGQSPGKQRYLCILPRRKLCAGFNVILLSSIKRCLLSLGSVLRRDYILRMVQQSAKWICVFGR